MDKPKPLMPVEAIVRVYHPCEGIYYYEVKGAQRAENSLATPSDNRRSVCPAHL